MKTNFEETLLFRITECKNIKQMLEIWSGEMNCPAVLVNASCFCIAAAGAEKARHWISWLEDFISGGILPQETAGIFSDCALQGSVTRLIPARPDMLVMKASQIRVRHENLYVVTIVKKEDEEILSHFEDFRIALSVFLSISFEDLDNRRLFVRDLLLGNIKTEKQAETRARALSIFVKSEKPVCLMAGRFVRPDFSKKPAIKDHIEDVLFPDSCVMDFGSVIAVLILEHAQVMRGSKNLRAARKYFEEMGLQFCICPPVHQFLTLAIQYRETLDMLDLFTRQKRQDSLFFFEQNVYNIILNDVPREDLEKLCNPAILKLYLNDVSYGTEDTLILYAYLLSFGNFSEMAEILDVSYNTVKKYTDRISHLLKRPFEEISIPYFISLKILGMLYPAFGSKCERIGSNVRGIKR